MSSAKDLACPPGKPWHHSIKTSTAKTGDVVIERNVIPAFLWQGSKQYLVVGGEPAWLIQCRPRGAGTDVLTYLISRVSEPPQSEGMTNSVLSQANWCKQELRSCGISSTLQWDVTEDLPDWNWQKSYGRSLGSLSEPEDFPPIVLSSCCGAGGLSSQGSLQVVVQGVGPSHSSAELSSLFLRALSCWIFSNTSIILSEGPSMNSCWVFTSVLASWILFSVTAGQVLATLFMISACIGLS